MTGPGPGLGPGHRAAPATIPVCTVCGQPTEAAVRIRDEVVSPTGDCECVYACPIHVIDAPIGPVADEMHPTELRPKMPEWWPGAA
ncbi:hypothetical protein ACFVT5_27985 [Streptomyces sp. NPDC058001]|uniref:hypothetical protein n=1 Tax=Streptomyces sp. NPDC058001 TaxID=3346300 RepID=UPI0036E96424